MNKHAKKFNLTGSAGNLEGILNLPEGAPRGIALVAHPHPLYGGTMDNKVVQTLARACLQLGWQTVRFNFRGIGASEGAWDEGVGEVDDALAVIAAHRQEAGAGEFVLAGFSFGAYVASQVAGGDRRIIGVMIESHLEEGRQDIVPGVPLKPGVSVTDACISMAQTIPVLQELARAVRARRAGAGASSS